MDGRKRTKKWSSKVLLFNIFFVDVSYHGVHIYCLSSAGKNYSVLIYVMKPYSLLYFIIVYVTIMLRQGWAKQLSFNTMCSWSINSSLRLVWRLGWIQRAKVASLTYVAHWPESWKTSSRPLCLFLMHRNSGNYRKEESNPIQGQQYN